MAMYGNGITMRDAIRDKTEEVASILNNSNLSAGEKETVLGALKEFAYQWCSANAFGCALNEAVDEVCGKIIASSVFQRVFHSNVQQEKMEETYPF